MPDSLLDHPAIKAAIRLFDAEVVGVRSPSDECWYRSRNGNMCFRFPGASGTVFRMRGTDFFTYVINGDFCQTRFWTEQEAMAHVESLA